MNPTPFGRMATESAPSSLGLYGKSRRDAIEFWSLLTLRYYFTKQNVNASLSHNRNGYLSGVLKCPEFVLN